MAVRLSLKGKVYSVDKTWTECKPDVTFKDKETEQSKTAHKTVLSQASPFFTTWFKEQWQQDKPSDEYPLPGDIDWEVFTIIISILYGEEVEFEEEALPDLFRAADYLQLDTLKVAIVVSLTEEWKVKNSEVVGAMLTAVASQSDGRVRGGLLALVSKNYFIRHIHTVVFTPTANISDLPYDTVKEIAQSEEVTAPEIELYHFMKKWADAKENDLTVPQMKDLFSHIRYATISHDNLEVIAKYSSNNNNSLASARSTFPNFSRRPKIDTKQFTTRKRQQPALLLNSPKHTKWTKHMRFEEPTCLEGYSIASSKVSGAIVVSWPTMHMVTTESRYCGGMAISITCTISALSQIQPSNPPTEKCTLKVKCTKNESDSKYIPDTGGLIIHITATGITMKTFDGSSEAVKATFNHPQPWLLKITSTTPFTAQTM